MVTKLGQYFTLEELTQSQTATRRGIDNTPDERVINELGWLVKFILDPLRVITKSPITISSGYRSPELNRAIGGSKTSQHCLGQAADINSTVLGTERLFNLIKNSNLPFDQLINEGTWVHVSYGYRNRREVLVATFDKGKVTYSPG